MSAIQGYEFRQKKLCVDSCFATQLIASGVPATVLMKICGWKDMKTMQRYIRLAGIDESGATERLSFIPTDEAVMERVVSLFDYK